MSYLEQSQTIHNEVRYARLSDPMDKLTDEQRESLKMTSTERSRVKLLRSGEEEEKVFILERKQLMDAIAALMVANPEGATAGEKRALKERDMELKARKLALRELEIKERKEAEENQLFYVNRKLRNAWKQNKNNSNCENLN